MMRCCVGCVCKGTMFPVRGYKVIMFRVTCVEGCVGYVFKGIYKVIMFPVTCVEGCVEFLFMIKK